MLDRLTIERIVEWTEGQQLLLALSGGGRFKLTNPYWSMVWRDRTPERWTELAHKYDFELVVSPEDTQLALPKIVDGNVWDLYRIPRH